MAIEQSNFNFEQCIKCTVCTVYCPIAAVNPLFPGPKQAGPDGERLRLKDKGFYHRQRMMARILVCFLICFILYASPSW